MRSFFKVDASSPEHFSSFKVHSVQQLCNIALAEDLLSHYINKYHFHERGRL